VARFCSLVFCFLDFVFWIAYIRVCMCWTDAFSIAEGAVNQVGGFFLFVSAEWCLTEGAAVIMSLY